MRLDNKFKLLSVAINSSLLKTLALMRHQASKINYIKYSNSFALIKILYKKFSYVN